MRFIFASLLITVAAFTALATDAGVTDAGPVEVREEKVQEKPAEDSSALVEQESKAQREAEENAKKAEAAQAEAKREAELTKNARLSEILNALATVEGLRKNLAEAKAELHEATKEEAAQIEEAHLKIATRKSVVEAYGDEDPRADAEVEAVLKEQQDTLGAVGAALDHRAEDALPEAVRIAAADPILKYKVGIKSFDDDEIETANDRLVDAIESTIKEVDAFKLEHEERWFRLAEQWLQLAHETNGLRVLLLARMTDDERSKVFGISDVGARNFGVAFLQMTITFRFHLSQNTHDIKNLFTRDIKTVSTGLMGAKLLWAFLLLVFATFFWRQAPELFGRTKSWLLSGVQSPRTARYLGGILDAFALITPRLYVIIIALWVFTTVEDIAPDPETYMILEVIIWINLYMLASKVGHVLVLRLARRRHSLTVPMKLKILRTVRASMRYIFAAAYILSATYSLVGGGVLYQVLKLTVTLGTLFTIFILVERWREDVIAAYLEGWPDTRLAHVVEEGKNRWYGFALPVAAFAFLAAKGVLVLGKDFVLGFEQSRVALAYLFRMRIEAQAREKVRRVVDLSALPEPVVEIFEEKPAEANKVLAGKILVDRFESSGKVRSLVDAFPEKGNCLLVHGDYGVGRTTWLAQLHEYAKDNFQVLYFEPSHRMLTTAALNKALLEQLQKHDETQFGGFEPEQIVEALRTAGQTMIILDGMEWLFLRSLAGCEAIDALTELIKKTRGTIFWTLSVPTPVQRYLSHTRHLEGLGNLSYELRRFSEEEIRQLIEMRQRVSGVKVSFDELLVREAGRDLTGTQVVGTQDDYLRLLWSFTEGNPRTALLFWLRSLVPNKDGLTVQLYDAPGANDLETLPESDRFFLAATLLHRALTAEELATACRLPVEQAEAHVGRGLDMGLYQIHGENARCISVTSLWWSGTKSFLRRKNLLP